MRFLWQTALKDLRLRLRDPTALLLWFLIPIVIGGVMSLVGSGGNGGGPQARVLVADLDDSFLSGLLLGALDGQSGSAPFVTEQVSAEEGRQRIDAGDGTAFLVIPAGFGEALLKEEAATLELRTNPSQRILPGMVEEALEIAVDGSFYLHRVFGEPLGIITGNLPEEGEEVSNAVVASTAVLINGIVNRIAEQAFPPAIGVDVQVEKKPDQVKQGFAELFFPSLLFMTIFFMASGQSEDIWKEKDQGTLRRALATPHRASAFLAGKLLAVTLLFGVVCLAGVCLARWGFGIALVNLPLAAAWAALSGAMLYVLLVLVQLHAGSQKAGSLLSNMIVLPLLMLGGSFFPFEMMPAGLAWIGRMTPNGWALVQLKAVLSGGFDVQSLAVSGIAVVLVGIALFAIAVRRMAGAFTRA